MQSHLEESENEKHLLLLEVVRAMRGRFGAPIRPRSELLISRLQGLANWFREIYQAIAVVMSHYEGGRAGRPKQRLL